MKLHKGFSQIDFVVTLLCAAFLIATMGAVGNRGRERAKQLVCASQLGKWGQAIIMHSEDNGGRLMFMIRRWDEGPFPHLMGQVPDYPFDDFPDGYYPDSEWNVFEINPYIGAFSETYDPFGDPQDCGITRLVACPSNDSEFMVDWCRWNCEGEWDFTEPGYSYWVIGGMPNPVDTGNPYNGSDGEGGDHVWQDLTLNTLSPGRLVMSDIMAIDYWGGPGWPYRYNHGINGWSWFAGDVAGQEATDPYPKATGRNQFFGDGAVKWRAIPAEYEDNLPNSEDVGPLEDRWNGPGSGWIQAWNTSYY
ncbi:MAG: hypothetical protein ACYS6I_02405 [Planctomycetota bacterium]|jgi:hypothetical protein